MNRLILNTAIGPSRDLAPLLPLEAVAKAITIHCHQPRAARPFEWAGHAGADDENIDHVRHAPTLSRAQQGTAC